MTCRGTAVRWSFVLVFALTACASAQQIADPPTKSEEKADANKRVTTEKDFDALIGEESPAITTRRMKIEAELAALDRTALKEGDWAKEWAGTYYTGDGTGMNVVIAVAPKSGITYEWHGCLGLHDANQGEIVEASPTGLKLKLAIDEHASEYKFMSSTLYFVRWGSRRFLVPESQMLELVNNYNEGGTARECMFSIPEKFEGQVKHRAWNEPPQTGRPELPATFAKLIIEKPLTLTITKVTTLPTSNITAGVRASESKVEFNGGRKQGAFVGQEIVYRSGRTFGKVVIDRVDEKTCEGTVRSFGGDDHDLLPPWAGAGLKFPGALPEVDRQKSRIDEGKK